MGHKLAGLNIFQIILGFQAPVYPYPTLEVATYTAKHSTQQAPRILNPSLRRATDERCGEMGPLPRRAHRGWRCPGSGKWGHTWERNHQRSHLIAVLLPQNYLVFVQQSPQMPQLYSTALISRFAHSIFNIKVRGFSSPNILHPSLCSKQAQKVNPFF